MLKRTRRTYTEEFQRAAVARLGTELRKDICADLGIVGSVLDRWRRLYPAAVTPAVGAITNGLTPAKPRGTQSTYPAALRAAAVERFKHGEKAPAIAAALGIPKHTLIYGWASSHVTVRHPKKVATPPSPPHRPAPPLHFCPNCGVPLSAFLKAAEATANAAP